MPGPYPLYTTVCLLLVFLLGWVAPVHGAQVTVSLPPSVTVSGPRILMGEVAFIDLLDPNALALAQALARVDLGSAPEAGKVVVLRRGQLEQRLLASRLNFTEVAFALPEELTVTGRGQELDEEDLKKALGEYLAGTDPYRGGDYRLLTVNFSSLPILPPGRVSYRFIPQKSANPTYFSGTFFFAVEGEEVGRTRVTAQVELLVEVLQVTRNMSRGQVLREGDLSLNNVPYAKARGALNDKALAVGQALKGSLKAGDILTERNLTKNIMVRRGETVTLTAQQGGLRVTATGEARQDGTLGETISILNTNSKKIISGRITGPGQVEIIF